MEFKFYYLGPVQYFDKDGKDSDVLNIYGKVIYFSYKNSPSAPVLKISI